MAGGIASGDEVIRRIQERRGGHTWPLHHLMAELDPTFLDVFDEAYVRTMGIEPVPSADSLGAKYRELICACACAIMPVPVEVTAHHLKRAFALGLSEQEAMEGFSSLLIPAGGIAVSNGARAIMHLREESERDDSDARTPSRDRG